MKKFDEAVPMRTCVPRDRTLIQLKHVFDGDDVGEALDDQAEEMRAHQYECMNQFREGVLIPLIAEIVAEAEERTRSLKRAEKTVELAERMRENC